MSCEVIEVKSEFIMASSEAKTHWLSLHSAKKRFVRIHGDVPKKKLTTQLGMHMQSLLMVTFLRWIEVRDLWSKQEYFEERIYTCTWV